MRTPRRDTAWFEALYRAHHGAVLRYAVRRIGPDEADDVVAEVFATAWRKLDAVGDPPLPWLYRTAHHHLLHTGRRLAQGARLQERLRAQPQADAPGPALRDPILDLLDRLSAEDAELLRLTAWEQLTPSEIAQVLGIKPGTVRVRLHRARQRAQAEFDASLSPASSKESS
ncbi:MAG: sigma-70 family RNA polymerase sigma factor [Propionibacteriaceae bacterium]|nr:sigma-70 family RNA polymerase sigma factor [Propionibacteriaceae bacterium]